MGITTATIIICFIWTVSFCSSTILLEDMFRGTSGKLEATFTLPDSLIVQNPVPGLKVKYLSDTEEESVATEFKAPKKPGIYQILLENNGAYKVLERLRLITILPFSSKKDGRIGKCFMGIWPYEKNSAMPVAYVNPAGFIEVTMKNINQRISRHFKLCDFVDKDQANVWPKYLVLDPRLVDKLELIIDELTRQGYAIKNLAIMCGFRSPHSNATFGDPRGRGKLSRHMFGDAADIYVDNNNKGWMSDLNQDGCVDIKDARIIAQAAEQVEAKYPKLSGGIGIYPGNGAHGPFIHVDVRGHTARW
ncbi:MAG: DUF882 domain-containing protein [Candidatus Margulisbacteria bacterium]|nr:DUF882 domain-containing protein [Candidatus Margulisiibacteriota bacterium]